MQFFDTRVNICYRIVNLWDVVPHLPRLLALYEHEGHSLHNDSGFSMDIVHNHSSLGTRPASPNGIRTTQRR